MLESNLVPPMVIYTDHSATVPISRQTTLNTTSIDKLNLRLIRASQYLSSFNLELRHKASKSNTIPNALSRLPQASVSSDRSKKGVLNTLYGHSNTWPEPTIMPSESIVYHATLIEISDNFKQRLKQAYQDDSHWQKLHEILKPTAAGEADSVNGRSEEKRVPGVPFVLSDELIYHIRDRWRLYIPASIEQEVFEQAHDLSNHGGYHRCHNRLSHTLFIRRLSHNLRAYIAHYPTYQLTQTKRHKPYGSLVLIATLDIPFHTITIDFIINLPPTVTGINYLLTITYKFTKRILLVAGKDT